MSPIENPRGLVYYCPVCGAEVTVLAFEVNWFTPRCCNVDMKVRPARTVFYVCPVCKAEIVVVSKGAGRFKPRCCNVDMIREAA